VKQHQFWFTPIQATRFFDVEIDAVEQLISRKLLAARWQCSVETIKRRTAAGQLHAIRFGPRMIRYALSEIIRVEQQAGRLRS
jgi:hypothetical protein